jgi:uncharacterized protein (DUF1501 family)
MNPTNETRSGRRSFVTTLAGGLFGALAADALLAREARAGGPPPKAKACIVLWMNGGPSHVDTFDPKPGAPGGGPFKAIKTRAPGLQICEHLPRVAEQAHHLAVVRGMTSKEGNHDRARHLLHTSYAPNPTVMHPSLGAWVSEELGAGAADLPAFVSIGGPSAGPGFLGAQHAPFVLKDAEKPPENAAYANDVDEARFDRRREALARLEDHFAAEDVDPRVAGRRAVYDKAVRLMRSPALSAFDIEGEPLAVRKAYGDSAFGRGCLAARRLVEAGVKLVEVTLSGWDTHQDNFTRTQALMGALDPAMAALLADLDKRRLLSSTLVVWMGEFGRTPRVNANEGRDHYPGAWTAVLAGGGVRGGVARGKTDADGGKVVEKPAAVSDLFTTLVMQMGIDPNKSFTAPSGRPITITDGGSALADLLA